MVNAAPDPTPTPDTNASPLPKSQLSPMPSSDANPSPVSQLRSVDKSQRPDTGPKSSPETVSSPDQGSKVNPVPKGQQGTKRVPFRRRQSVRFRGTINPMFQPEKTRVNTRVKGMRFPSSPSEDDDRVRAPFSDIGEEESVPFKWDIKRMRVGFIPMLRPLPLDPEGNPTARPFTSRGLEVPVGTGILVNSGVGSRGPSVIPQRPFDGSSGRPFNTPSGQPFDGSSGRPFNTPSGQPFDGSSSRPFNNPSGQPFDGSSGRPFNNPSGQPFDGSSGRPFDNPSGQPFDGSSGRPFNNPSGQPFDGSSGRPFNNPSEQPFDGSSGRPFNNPSGQPFDGSSGRPSGGNTPQFTFKDVPPPPSFPSLPPKGFQSSTFPGSLFPTPAAQSPPKPSTPNAFFQKTPRPLAPSSTPLSPFNPSFFNLRPTTPSPFNPRPTTQILFNPVSTTTSTFTPNSFILRPTAPNPFSPGFSVPNILFQGNTTPRPSFPVSNIPNFFFPVSNAQNPSFPVSNNPNFFSPVSTTASPAQRPFNFQTISPPSTTSNILFQGQNGQTPFFPRPTTPQSPSPQTPSTPNTLFQGPTSTPNPVFPRPLGSPAVLSRPAGSPPAFPRPSLPSAQPLNPGNSAQGFFNPTLRPNVNQVQLLGPQSPNAFLGFPNFNGIPGISSFFPQNQVFSPFPNQNFQFPNGGNDLSFFNNQLGPLNFPSASDLKPTRDNTSQEDFDTASSASSPPVLQPPHHQFTHEPYSYGYSVDSPASGDVKSVQEEKDSQGVVRGSSSLLQSDGRVRLVSYVADLPA